MKKQLFSLLLAVCLILQSVMPVFATGLTADATAPQTGNELLGEIDDINPLYRDVYDENDLKKPSASSANWIARMASVPEYTSDLKKAGEEVRSKMASQAESITVYLTRNEELTDMNGARSVFTEILANAFLETDRSDEGDYLRWTYKGWKLSVYKRTEADDSGNLILPYKYEFKITMTYLLTPEQAAFVDTEVAKLTDRIEAENKTDYRKIQAAYDLVCNTVSYDHEHADDYAPKYTPYGALYNRKAICQGYATLMYRLLKEMGISCRIISGLANGTEKHGWNIVRLNGLYYGLDATWDAGKRWYDYFLVDEGVMSDDHIRGSVEGRLLDGFNTAAFHEAHPMAPTSYAQNHPHEYSDQITVLTPSTCTTEGSATANCVVYGCEHMTTVSLPIDPSNHRFANYIRREGTCIKNAVLEAECENGCGEKDIQELEGTYADHTPGSWTTVRTATVFVKEEQICKCAVCKAEVGRREVGTLLKPTIKVTASTIPLKLKQSTTKFKVTGLAAGDYVKSWKSSNTKVFTVTGQKDGTCKITAGSTYNSKNHTAKLYIILASDPSKQYAYTVSIQKTAVAVSSIGSVPKSISVAKGKTYQLKPVLKPFTTTYKTYYSTSSKSIATVSTSGKITGKKKGKCTIKVKAGKKYVKVTVTVK